MVNGIVDSNWRHILESIKSDLEIHLASIIKSIVEPITDEVPIKEFIYEQSVLEEISIASVPENSDSSRSNSNNSNSRVLQNLAFSLLIWSVLLK